MTQKMIDEISLQVEDNSPSMENHRTHPMFVSWFLSLITRPPKCPKAITTILHIIYFVIYSVIVACDAKNYLAYTNDLNNFYESAINRIIFHAYEIIIYVSMYYYGYHNIKQYEKWPKLLSKMKNLDQQISIETPMNDRSIKIVEVLVILGTLSPLFLIITAYYYYFTNLYENYDMSFGYYTLAQSLINSFIFDVIVYVLYHRFQTINKLIMQLNKQFNAPLITSKIKCIRILHNEICDAVIMVNNIHGFHLLLFSAYCTIIVVCMLHYIYILAEEVNEFELTHNIFWIFCTAQFGVTCWICTLVRQESENTKVIISTIALNCNDVNLDNQNGMRNQSNVEVSSENQDSEHNSNRRISNNENRDVSDRDRNVEKEINNFSIQLQQHRVAITACNFFEMNNALFSCFVGAIINYLIILIQCYKPYRSRLKERDDRYKLFQIWNIVNASQSILEENGISDICI